MEQKLRWGIMGCAQIAVHAVIPAIMESARGTVTAVASRGLDKSAALAAQLGIEKAYGSYEELLTDGEIDAVYIPLPNHLHREWVIRAAQAGKHVLCEKPIALNSGEAAEMVAACKEAGVYLAEAFMYRHHPQIELLQEIIARGEIGELRSIRGTFTYNDAQDTSNIRFKAAWGGGALYDVGCYPLSAARLLFGTEPEAVTVQALFSPEHDDVDMMASGLVEFPGGVSLIFDCGMWAYNRQLLEVLGTEGRIEIPMPFNARFEDAGFTLYKNGEAVAVAAPGANPYVRQADHFAEAVFSRESRASADDPVLNMRLIETCLESAKRRERIAMI